MPIKPGLIIAIGAASLSMGAFPRAIAQEGGLQLTLDFAQSLRASDNNEFIASPSGNTYFARTDLGFGLKSETSSQIFSLDFGAALEAGHFADTTGSGSEIKDEYARLSYSRETSSARLSTNASITRFDVTDNELSDDFDNTDLVADVGVRNQYKFGAGLETGIGGPFGLSLNGSFTKQDYTDTTDPSLFDNDTRAFDATARFRVTPTVDLRALAGISEYTAEDTLATERVKTYVGLGVDYEISPSLQFSGELRHDRTETTETIGLVRVVRVEDGPGLDLTLTHDRPNGTLAVSFASDISSTGRRNNLSVERSMELPRGALSYSLGVTKSDNTDLEPTLGLTYEQELARGSFNVSLTQTALTDNDDDEALRTRLSAGYSQEINTISGWDAGLSFADYNVLTVGGTDTRRIDLDLSYRRELTRDWDLRVGYEHAYLTETGSANKRSNTVFVTLERSFSFSP